ncbi:hypothetical protein I4U23_009224 [Adineta vaga]|nr:hypothetical protein I4U23_009224 [Adineta vaga]
MNKTLLILCLMIGVVSSNILAGIIQQIQKDPFTTVCTFVKNKSEVANTIVSKLNEALAKGDGTQKFPLTIAYVSNKANQNSFAAGGATCVAFFNGLQAEFSKDLENNGVKNTNVRQKLIEFFKNKNDALTVSFN